MMYDVEIFINLEKKMLGLRVEPRNFDLECKNFSNKADNPVDTSHSDNPLGRKSGVSCKIIHQNKPSIMNGRKRYIFFFKIISNNLKIC